jgi:ABC-type bacteriocin/lantibiotic exporter with double-glycine peptidase domain
MDDTIQKNLILYNEKNFDKKNILEVIKKSNLEKTIKNLPKGLSTVIGERGDRLSAGQRQRIGIARALYRNPQVLILDEATSALDNLTESAVMTEIHKIGNKKTVILIAHRLTTLKECDIIFLLNNGKLEAQGTYDELIKSNDQFRANASKV